MLVCHERTERMSLHGTSFPPIVRPWQISRYVTGGVPIVVIHHIVCDGSQCGFYRVWEEIRLEYYFNKKPGCNLPVEFRSRLMAFAIWPPASNSVAVLAVALGNLIVTMARFRPKRMLPQMTQRHQQYLQNDDGTVALQRPILGFYFNPRIKWILLIHVCPSFLIPFKYTSSSNLQLLLNECSASGAWRRGEWGVETPRNR
jgi:hypothetical protein